MRVTVPHNRTKQEAIQSVDRAFNEMFQGVAGVPVRLTVQQRNWQGSTLTFALSAKMGLISTPITGTIEVTDKDLTIDADLGLLGRFIPAATVREWLANADSVAVLTGAGISAESGIPTPTRFVVPLATGAIVGCRLHA